MIQEYSHTVGSNEKKNNVPSVNVRLSIDSLVIDGGSTSALSLEIRNK